MLYFGSNLASSNFISLLLLSFYSYLSSAIQLSDVRLQSDAAPRSSHDVQISRKDRNEFMSYSVVIRLRNGPIREHLADEHLLYIAKVMAEEMQTMGRRDRVIPPTSLGVWAINDILYIASTMQWPDSFNDHSAQLMFIAVKNGNSNSLRSDIDFAMSLGERAISLAESNGGLPDDIFVGVKYNQGQAGYYIDDQGCATYTSPSQWLGLGQYPVAVWDSSRQIPLQYCSDEKERKKWGCYTFINSYFPDDMHSIYRKGMRPSAFPVNALDWEQIPTVRAAYGHSPPTIRIQPPQAPSGPSGGPSGGSTRRSILMRGSNYKAKDAVTTGTVQPKVINPAYQCG